MNLDTFFKPKSIAVIGASRNKNKIGRIIFDQLAKNFKVFPVNPNAKRIGSYKSFKSILEIEEKVDLAVIAIPAKFVPSALKDCVEKGVKSVIIISGGFSETGTREGKKLEEKLKKVVKESKTRFIGPNVMGLYDAYTNLDTIFIPKKRMKRPGRGSISFISQSGAVGVSILDWLAEKKIGISKFVSYGNATDVNECDLLEYMINDRMTKVVTLYLEGIKGDGKRFIKIAKKLTKKKPVVVLKAGKTKKGMKAVM
ncbi:MAG TPA: CoA-binding protein, partial [Candidatus Aenigmarchaeota archaeon]|nr:CoA-binding protein [Candidatus Aenigmarchaeota archaeon]